MAQQFDLDRSREAVEFARAGYLYREPTGDAANVATRPCRTVAKESIPHCNGYRFSSAGKEGSVVATNGHQLLVQKGLLLGW